MRKLILLLTLIGGSVLFFGVATPTASAGNCTAITFNYNGHPNAIWYDGKWAWNPVVGGCSGVSAIHFVSYVSAYNGFPPFLYDSTNGAYHFPNEGGGYCYGNPTLTNCNALYRNPVWGNGCGAPPMWVTAYFQYRIRSYPGQTWGSYHVNNSVGQWIC